MEDDENLERTKIKTKDLLKCGICSQNYEDPRRLPCNHTFCHRCLQMSFASGSSFRKGRSFQCPSCFAQIGIPHGGVGEFPVDIRIERIKESAVNEMKEILLRKLHARKGSTSFDSSSFDEPSYSSFNRMSSMSDIYDEELLPHLENSISFQRNESFNSFDNRHYRNLQSESQEQELQEKRFSRQRPMYSSLREVHRRKASDLRAAFDSDVNCSSSFSFRHDETSTDSRRQCNNDSHEKTLINQSDLKYERELGNNVHQRSRYDDEKKDVIASNEIHCFSKQPSTTTADIKRNAFQSSEFNTDSLFKSSQIRERRGYQSLRENRQHRNYFNAETVFKDKLQEFSHMKTTDQESSYDETDRRGFTTTFTSSSEEEALPIKVTNSSSEHSNNCVSSSSTSFCDEHTSGKKFESASSRHHRTPTSTLEENEDCMKNERYDKENDFEDVLQEFDFLSEHLNEDEGIELDSEKSDSVTSVTLASSKTTLREIQHEQEGSYEEIFTSTINSDASANETEHSHLKMEKNVDGHRLTRECNYNNNTGFEKKIWCDDDSNDDDDDVSARKKNFKMVGKKHLSAKSSFIINHGERKQILNSNGTERFAKMPATEKGVDHDEEEKISYDKQKDVTFESLCSSQMEHKVQNFSINNDINTKQKSSVNKEGTATLKHLSKEEYIMPTGVAILSQGNTVVADYGTGSLQYHDVDGSVTYRIEGIKPFSIAVNQSNDQVIVGDRKSKTICLFDDCGGDVAQWQPNMFNWICGIGIRSNGQLVILDREKSRIGIYQQNGEMVSEFSSYGNEDGQLCMGEFLVVDNHDRIVACDSGNHCIKVFSVSGLLLKKFGSRGCEDGELQWPKGVCIDDANNIIVADTCNNRLSMFSSDGNFMQHLVTQIVMPYAVSYSHPDVAVTRYSVMRQSQFLLYNVKSDD